MVAQGELWLMETPNKKRRPVLIVSRTEAIPVLNNIVVAPVTRTIRRIATCIPVALTRASITKAWQCSMALPPCRNQSLRGALAN